MRVQQTPQNPAPPSQPKKPNWQRLRSLQKWRKWAMGTVFVAVFIELFLLSPVSLERQSNPDDGIDPEDILFFDWKDPNHTKAPGIPFDRIPDYTIEGYRYTSSQASVKQWKLFAKKAYLYKPEDIVHAIEMTAWIYDPDGSFTFITASEAKYFLHQKDLEVFGSVTAKFQDGFEIQSEYARYQPKERTFSVPTQYAIKGSGKGSDQHDLLFNSYGLQYSMEKNEIHLLDRSQFRVIKKSNPNDWTTIDSNVAVIDRKKQVAVFKMKDSQPIETRFAVMKQPDLEVKSRWMDLHYGNQKAESGGSGLKYLTAYDDVTIKELGNSATRRHATCGKADFDSQNNKIILTLFPQVYQDNDTVTGEKVIIYRDSDIVEVERSNAFSHGK